MRFFLIDFQKFGWLIFSTPLYVYILLIIALFFGQLSSTPVKSLKICQFKIVHSKRPFDNVFYIVKRSENLCVYTYIRIGKPNAVAREKYTAGACIATHARKTRSPPAIGIYSGKMSHKIIIKKRPRLKQTFRRRVPLAAGIYIYIYRNIHGNNVIISSRFLSEY